MNKTNDAEIHWRPEWKLHWPNYDAAPERTYRYVQKHIGDVDMTINAARGYRVCIQAGGHVGLWPLKLAENFDRVFTFEPDPHLFRCLVRNTNSKRNIICSQAALGRERGHLKLLQNAKAGSWRIHDTGTHLVNVETIDGIMEAHGLEHCDALILDIEGHEIEALRGADKTIKTYRPVIHVEELGTNWRASVQYMASIHYREAGRAGRDVLYTYRGDKQC